MGVQRCQAHSSSIQVLAEWLLLSLPCLRLQYTVLYLHSYIFLDRYPVFCFLMVGSLKVAAGVEMKPRIIEGRKTKQKGKAEIKRKIKLVKIRPNKC